MRLSGSQKRLEEFTTCNEAGQLHCREFARLSKLRFGQGRLGRPEVPIAENELWINRRAGVGQPAASSFAQTVGADVPGDGRRLGRHRRRRRAQAEAGRRVAAVRAGGTVARRPVVWQAPSPDSGPDPRSLRPAPARHSGAGRISFQRRCQAAFSAYQKLALWWSSDPVRARLELDERQPRLGPPSTIVFALPSNGTDRVARVDPAAVLPDWTSHQLQLATQPTKFDARAGESATWSRWAMA